MDLPSSFRYWKSHFFFVSGDDWETPFDEEWGDLSRLLCQWRTLSLGASLFLQEFYSSFVLVHFVVANSSVHCLVQSRNNPSLRVGISNVLRLP